MKKLMVILSVFIICVCILNYNNKDAKFSFENYIIELSENISYLPKPPDVSSFKSFTQYVEDIDDEKCARTFFNWFAYTFSILWDFICYPFKVLFWLVYTIGVFFKNLIVWG